MSTCFVYVQDLSSPSFEDLIASKDDKLEKDFDVERGLLSKLVAKGVVKRSHTTDIEVNNICLQFCHLSR